MQLSCLTREYQYCNIALHCDTWRIANFLVALILTAFTPRGELLQ
jgi:hypothetical protein